MSVRYNPADAFRVCVDLAEPGRIAGRVLSCRLTRPLEFSSLGDLLFRLEAVLDAQNRPQAHRRTRTFSPLAAEEVPAALSPEEGMASGAVEAERGAVSTFHLLLLGRRNSTWQGHIDRLDGSPGAEFSSVLELVRLIGGLAPC